MWQLLDWKGWNYEKPKCTCSSYDFWKLGMKIWNLRILEVIMPRFQEASMPTPTFIDYCTKCTFGTYSHASTHNTFSTCNEVSMHKEFSTHNDASTCNDTPRCELMSTISNHTNNSLATNSIILTSFYIVLLNISE